MEFKVIIIGGEGTATNIAEAIIDSYKNYNSKIEFIGFANDNYGKKDNILGHEILCNVRGVAELLKHKDVRVIYAMYKPMYMHQRTLLLESLSLPINSFASFIHPSSYLAPSVKIGVGNAILPNVAIHNHAEIGDFNIINSGTIIEHDSKIGSSNFIGAGTVIGSSVIVNNSCFFGMNCSLIESISIPHNTFIGMGSVVLKTPRGSNEIWYGVPAKKIRNNDN